VDYGIAAVCRFCGEEVALYDSIEELAAIVEAPEHTCPSPLSQLKEWERR
jgi:hypothetical protein